jgi:hypothetical protein
LTIANHERKHLTVLLGNGKGQFQPAPHSPFFVNVRPHTHGVIIADFNGDGNPDIGTESWGVDSIVILQGDGKSNFSNPAFYATGKHPYQRLRTVDLNNDGKPDIVTTNLDGNDVTILLGDGRGSFSKRLFKAGDTPFGVAIGDLTGDGNLDLAVVNSPSIAGNAGKDGLTILTGDGTGNFSRMEGSPFISGLSPSRVAIGDLNGDGVNDVAVTNYMGRSISVYYLHKKGAVSISTFAVGDHPSGVAIHDLDGDGKKDIIVSSHTENTILIFFAKT